MRVAAPILVVLVLLAGCGGGGGGSRLSEAEFIAAADAICKEYEAKLNAIPAPQSPDEFDEFADKSIPIAKEGRDKLAALNPPEDLQDTFDAWIGQGDRAIELVENLRDAADDADQAKLQQIAQEAEQTNQESNRLASQIGFKECGETA